MMQLHRFLAMGEYGKQVTAACTLILIFFCLSGSTCAGRARF